MKTTRCIVLSIAALAAIMSAYGEESLLLHRWSFNGDLTDSVGGQTIIECAGGFTGDFAEGSVIPESYVVSKGRTSVRLVQRGLMIIVK